MSRHPPNETPNMPLTRAVKLTKRITKHTEEELTAAVEAAVAACPDFYKILHGVDAYMERRKRWDARDAAARHARGMDDLADPWGDS